jgi:tetratricopeptide (TPR) repeat protein
VLAGVSLGWLDPNAPAREGNRLYESGKYDDAAEQYNHALVDQPDSPRLHFNLGDARYKAGKYDDAIASFGKVTADGTDPGRTARVAYNVGNTKFRQGEAVATAEPQKAIGLWTEALVAYRQALSATPDDLDAKYNHELVERRIAALRKKLEEQQQKQQQQDQQKNQEQQRDQQKSEDQKQGQDQQQAGEQQQQNQQQQPGEQQADNQQADQKQGQGKEQQQGEDAARDEQKEQAAEQPTGGEEQQAGRPDGGEPDKTAQAERAGQAGAGGEREMTSEEAAALLDAQRSQEVQPGELLERRKNTRVAEPAQDW